MGILTIPDNLRTLLSALSDHTELRDEAGNPLGMFTPQKVADDELYEWAAHSFDLGEAKRRLEEFLASGEKGYSSEEVLAELDEMERSQCSSE